MIGGSKLAGKERLMFHRKGAEKVLKCIGFGAFTKPYTGAIKVMSLFHLFPTFKKKPEGVCT